MTKFLARFANDESGATAVEYGLIAALISIAIIAGTEIVGTQINATFDNIGAKVQASGAATAN
ncbi:Flp family type IVb pilin [Coralliovum pocilloporae]|uniref:Flp family type IVb pilin n=1 Tax=Coralliovum pocilloporae TaxID=3066369 RepID=UPI0033069F49